MYSCKYMKYYAIKKGCRTIPRNRIEIILDDILICKRINGVLNFGW